MYTQLLYTLCHVNNLSDTNKAPETQFQNNWYAFLLQI